MNGSRFHFHHRPFGRPGTVGRVAALEHDAFDRVGVGAGAGAGRIGARAREVVPARERNERREIDARIVEARDQRFEPRAALRERPLAQVLLALDQEIVGAQMRGEFGEQLRRHGLAVEPLLQHVERLHAAVAQDQQLAVDRAVEPQRLGQIGKAFGDVLAGARIEPRRKMPVGARRRHRLHADAVPLPFRREVGGIERGEIRLLDRMRQHHRAERRRIAAAGLSARPSIQANSSG